VAPILKELKKNMNLTFLILSNKVVAKKKKVGLIYGV
jgi:hypothetical protein